MPKPTTRKDVPSDVRRCRVEATTHIPGVGGKNVGPGQLVDLDEVVGNGLRVRELFPEEWFEPVAAPPATFEPPAGVEE